MAVVMRHGASLIEGGIERRWCSICGGWREVNGSEECISCGTYTARASDIRVTIGKVVGGLIPPGGVSFSISEMVDMVFAECPGAVCGYRRRSVYNLVHEYLEGRVTDGSLIVISNGNRRVRYMSTGCRVRIDGDGITVDLRGCGSDVLILTDEGSFPLVELLRNRTEPPLFGAESLRPIKRYGRRD